MSPRKLLISPTDVGATHLITEVTLVGSTAIPSQEPKLTFAELGIQLMFSELLKNQTQMLLMLLSVLRVDQYIMNEHHDELIQKSHKHFVHHVHEIGRCGSQTK